nr:unnamed protein product [Callosobruchus chinensis]
MYIKRYKLEFPDGTSASYIKTLLPEIKAPRDWKE